MTNEQRKQFNIKPHILKGVFEEGLGIKDPETLNSIFSDTSDFIINQENLIKAIDKKHNYDYIQLMELIFGTTDILYIMYDALLDGATKAMIQVEYKNFEFDGFSIWDEMFDPAQDESKHIGEYR